MPFRKKRHCKIEVSMSEMEQEESGFFYQSFNEALTVLKGIKPANLKSNYTSKTEAVRLCKEVLTVIQKCERLKFDTVKSYMLQETLKSLGCVKYDEANDKFKTSGASMIGEVLGIKNNIEFPLSFFTNIVGVEQDTFHYGMSKAMDGGKENSWVGCWLAAQNKETSQNKAKAK